MARTVEFHIKGTPADVQLTQHKNKNWKVEVADVRAKKRYEIARSLSEAELAELTKFLVKFFTVSFTETRMIKKLREQAHKIKHAHKQTYLAKMQQIDPHIEEPMKEYQVDVRRIDYGFITVIARSEADAMTKVKRMHDVELEDSYKSLELVPVSATAVDDL